MRQSQTLLERKWHKHPDEKKKKGTSSEEKELVMQNKKGE